MSIATVPLFLLLAAFVLLSSASAQAPEGMNQVQVSVLKHHPYPDKPLAEGGDPLGFPAANVSGRPSDWMRYYYGAYVTPTTVFDGIDIAESVKNSNQAEFYQDYRLRLMNQLSVGSPLVVRVEGTLTDEQGEVSVRIVPISQIRSGTFVARVVVFEDDVQHLGENGVPVHRFVAREMLAPETVTLEAGEPVAFNRTFQVGTNHEGKPWDTSKLGVVAYVQQVGDDGGQFEPKQVLQSATYLFRQVGPTSQVQKSVLIEEWTASWCPACVYGDGAVDLLARQFGIASASDQPDGPAYFEPLPARSLLLGGLAGGTLALVLLPRRWFS